MRRVIIEETDDPIAWEMSVTCHKGCGEEVIVDDHSYVCVKCGDIEVDQVVWAIDFVD